ncbi:uncharacterized protein BXZ73DRAFT_74874 [Epithele typhae]|uniref:uncharacterized protein n=1 Tax=Epithele typhae TaxID=378194 RepID=UPI002007BAAF|nr:uncharacterized protein BXZ73DRAFT_74874 [Epithele typhae]KAH9941672.1 hypothetical protein BXZ73DRAFT_74874 [Epithele typhae]
MGSQPTNVAVNVSASWRARASFQNKCTAVGGVTLITYDYLLTLDREIRYIWRGKFTGASAIYIVTRYSSLASHIVNSLNLFPWPGDSSAVSVFLTPEPQQIPATSDALNVADVRTQPRLCHGTTVAFSVMGAVVVVGAAALGSANAVPLVYGATKIRSRHIPGPNNISTKCIVDFLRHKSFRTDHRRTFLWSYLRLAGPYVDVETCKAMERKRTPEISPAFVGALPGTAAVLTSRFILDLFEASTRTRFGTGPTVRLSDMPSMVPSRLLASRHVGGLAAAGPSRGIFDADVSWRGTEDSESVSGTTDDYDFELRPVNLEQHASAQHRSDNVLDDIPRRPDNNTPPLSRAQPTHHAPDLGRHTS